MTGSWAHDPRNPAMAVPSPLAATWRRSRKLLAIGQKAEPVSPPFRLFLGILAGALLLFVVLWSAMWYTGA